MPFFRIEKERGLSDGDDALGFDAVPGLIGLNQRRTQKLAVVLADGV